MLPLVPLYHEAVASSDVIAYLESHGTAEQQAEAVEILYPAYGTYVGSAFGQVVPAASLPLYYGSVIAGHAAGRIQSSQLRQQERASTKTVAATKAQMPATDPNQSCCDR
jgi:hypothetical protein